MFTTRRCYEIAHRTILAIADDKKIGVNCELLNIVETLLNFPFKVHANLSSSKEAEKLLTKKTLQNGIVKE